MSDWEGEFEPPTGEATYTGNPSTRPIDAVRLELGKDQSLTLLSDSEIQYNLSRAGDNVLLAASFCAETIAGMYAGMVDKSIGSRSISNSQRAEAWRKKATALRTQALNMSLTPRASGSASGSSAADLKFRIGQHDNPGATGSTGYVGDEWW